MSGVNCTRRNSTPIARANALATSVLATPGHAFEQQMTADGHRREQHLDHAVLADDDLANLPHHAIAQLVHVVLPSCCDKRETSRPSASAASSSVGGCQIAARSASEYPSAIAARSISSSGASGRRCARRATCARAHCCIGVERAARIAGAFERDGERRARIRPAAGGSSRAAGRADRTGGSATTRARPRRPRALRAPASTASGSRRARGARRSRAPLRRTRPAGSRRRRARARTPRCRRVAR